MGQYITRYKTENGKIYKVSNKAAEKPADKNELSDGSAQAEPPPKQGAKHERT